MEKSIPVFKKYSVVRAGVFGSYAKGEEKKDSDVDFLVEVPRGTGLFKFSSLRVDLEKALGKKVGLVSYNSIKKEIKDDVLNFERKIF